MSVTAVNERFQDDEAERTFDELTAHRSFDVYVDSRDDSAALAEAAVGVNIEDGYPGDSRRKCHRILTKRVADSDTIWRVDCDYSTTLPQQQFTENPLDREPVFSGDFDSFRQPIYVDEDGKAITGSSGFTFDPPVDEDFSDPWLNVEFNTATLNLPQLIRYMNAVADDAVYGANPGEAKITGIRWQRVRESGVLYFSKSFRISFRSNFVDALGKTRSGWTRLVLDEGIYSKTIPTGTEEDYFTDAIQPILDAKSGQEVRQPVKLDGRGHPIRSTTPIQLTEDDYPFVASSDGLSVFRHIPPRIHLPFSALNLPALVEG